MRFSTTLSADFLLVASAAGFTQAAAGYNNKNNAPGYTCQPHCIASTIPSNESSTLSFGKHYAILNLDLIPGIMSPIINTTAGQTFINSTSTWINAVAAQNPPPLTLFTRIYFSNSRQPEIGPQSPFAQVAGTLGTSADPLTEIYSAFQVNETRGDVVLQKTRYYAGAGNGLEEILRAQRIDTVVLSGIRTSGVILNTAYRLFDADYKV